MSACHCSPADCCMDLRSPSLPRLKLHPPTPEAPQKAVDLMLSSRLAEPESPRTPKGGSAGQGNQRVTALTATAAALQLLQKASATLGCTCQQSDSGAWVMLVRCSLLGARCLPDCRCGHPRGGIHRVPWCPTAQATAGALQLHPTAAVVGVQVSPRWRQRQG
jgi:hypothetical protein